MNIFAYDSMFPTQRVTTTVTLNVLHNPHAPVVSGTYQKNITEDWPFGDPIFNLTGTDADGVSIISLLLLTVVNISHMNWRLMCVGYLFQDGSTQ